MSSENKQGKAHKTTIGGQALIEGVMMRGPYTSAMAVRKPDGSIYTETWSTGNKNSTPWYKKTPVVRGSFNFIDMMLLGYKTLMKSAELSENTEEPSKFEKMIMDKFGDKSATIFSVLTLILAMTLSIGLFIVLPTLSVSLLKPYISDSWILATIEGVTKIAIFLLYMFLVSRLEDVKRVFMYHGAEHKTIACYEDNRELTVENIMEYSRFHPRCGTSFLLIVLVVSIIVFSLVSWSDPIMRVVIKVVLLPLVVGIAYEIIRIAGRHDNPVTRFISAPGIWLQNFTTFEPEKEMIEVAIASMTPCIPEEKGADKW